MALRIATRLPRLVIVGVVLLLASATLAVGAAKRLTAVPSGAPAPVAVATLVVPDLSGQAFVFAKGIARRHRLRLAGHRLGARLCSEQGRQPVPARRHACARHRRADHHRDARAHALSGEGRVPKTFRRTSARRFNPSGSRRRLSLRSRRSPLLPRERRRSPCRTKAEPNEGRAAVAAPAERPPAFVVAGAPTEPLNEMALTQRADAALGVDRRASEDQGERAPLPLPAQLDRHRRRSSAGGTEPKRSGN